VVEIIKNEGCWRISGDLVLADIEKLLAESVVVDGSATLKVDMAGVAEVDSAAISLLFEWLRQAKAGGCDLSYANLPANLTSLATLYGVLDLIPLAADPAATH
jgi:phospholipid transport system transporter-binding protein